MSKKIELVIAKATKIAASDSLVVIIDPQFADMAQDVYEEIKRVTGHEKHTVLPIPDGAIKFYRVENDLIVEQANVPTTLDMSGPQVPADEKVIYLATWNISDRMEPGTIGYRLRGLTAEGVGVDFVIPEHDLNYARQRGQYKYEGKTYVFGESR